MLLVIEAYFIMSVFYWVLLNHHQFTAFRKQKFYCFFSRSWWVLTQAKPFSEANNFLKVNQPSTVLQQLKLHLRFMNQANIRQMNMNDIIMVSLAAETIDSWEEWLLVVRLFGFDRARKEEGRSRTITKEHQLNLPIIFKYPRYDN